MLLCFYKQKSRDDTLSDKRDIGSSSQLRDKNTDLVLYLMTTATAVSGALLIIGFIMAIVGKLQHVVGCRFNDWCLGCNRHIRTFSCDSSFYQIEHFKAQVRQDKTQPKCDFKSILFGISHAN